jgi:xylose dehydrogenase (NAD/NADP)
VTQEDEGGEGVRWGVLSTARINASVLPALTGSEAVEVVAVASRAVGRAEAFAWEWGIPQAFGSYEELLASDDVEAVYIPLPNGLHVEWTLAALEAGKHVLVEKAFSPRAAEVERCFALAEERGLVLSEAFMWRHNPQTERLVSLLPRIGELRLVRASFSFPLVGRDDDVRWDPTLDGGALLDVGCYCVSAARLFGGGEPLSVDAMAVDRGGVDSRFTGLLRFDGDVLATFDCGFDIAERDELELVGSEGSLFVDDPWHCRTSRIEVRTGAVETVEVPAVSSYRLEFEDVSAVIRGVRDEPLLGRDDAVGQARTLEALIEAAA